MATHIWIGVNAILVSIPRNPNFSPLPEIRDAVEQIKSMATRITNLETAICFTEMMAEATFLAFSNHIPMLFLFDQNWNIVNQTTTQFADQADKFIFWRKIADQISEQQIEGIIWISESWLRELPNHPYLPIRKMPISGEILHVMGVDRSGTILQKTWRILRISESEKTSLEEVSSDDPMVAAVPYYLVPPMRAMGIEDPLSKIPKTFIRTTSECSG